MLATIAAAINDCNNAIIAAYQSFSPLYAQGVGLSTVVKINGLRRLVPSNSTATVTVVGQVGTEIVNGLAGDIINQQWALPASVIIPPAGTIDVTATAVLPGAIQASPATITNILTPTRGWQTVNNAAAATPGSPVEDDATLRQRQSVSTQIPAISVIGAIQGALKNLVGVGRVFIYENQTGTTDANGVPGHSICAVVEGGDINSIASTIARYKTPGTGTYGSTAVTVDDPLGNPITINFDELTLVEQSTLVFITAEAGYANSTGAAIQAALAYWYNSLAIGQDSFLGKLWSPVNLTGDPATIGTGMLQSLLDALGETYNATAIYQARADMIVVGGPFNAGANVIHVTNCANYANGKLIAVELDNGTYLLTSVTGVAAPAVTMAANIPGGRTVQNGAFVYVAGDEIVAFNEALEAQASDTTLVVT